jgi:cobalt-zinc-cadmium resistance protein CzcA
MFQRIIRFSLQNKLIIGLGIIALIIAGIASAGKIPLDAVPDITNNQVQVVSVAPTYAPQEVEQLITFPLEAALANLPYVEEVRSISRYGLSVITVVFQEDLDILKARQYCKEQLDIATGSLPENVDTELMPITTGLGEVYQYVLTVDSAHQNQYTTTQLRTIQDWIIKRQLNGTKGVIEISSFGGFIKQYEVALDPVKLDALNLHIQEVIESLEQNNQNSGGSYIEQGTNAFYIRTEGRMQNLEDIEATVIAANNGVPITIGQVANVGIGSPKRYGAMTMDGKGEVVGGITLMLKGSSSSKTLANVKERIKTIEDALPEGVGIYPYLDRSDLIAKTIDTVKNNLLEGGLIVIFVLFFLLGNLRAGLIVASVIPLSMLFALIGMQVFGVSANLMSLGAVDFGIVVDGAVIIIESLLFTLSASFAGQTFTQQKMDDLIENSSSKIYTSAAFGVLIILLVFVPILTLEGIEGKTFRPMAQTVSFTILGSLILSLTYVPVAASLFLKKRISAHRNKAEEFIEKLNQFYAPSLKIAMSKPFVSLGIALFLFAGSLVVFNNLGGEFVPTLEEGDLAMQVSIKPGSSLEESIRTCTMAEEILKRNFPEVKHVVSKIGTAEVPTDPMAIEDADVMILMKDKKHWTSAKNREQLVEKMKESLAPISWASIEFTQPIQLRFNELMTGSKADISVKIFGENVETLKQIADEAALSIQDLPGVGDIKVDQTEGLQQWNIKVNRDLAARYGVRTEAVNQAIRAAYAGETVGRIFEEERSFDLVVRFKEAYRSDVDLNSIYVESEMGNSVPLAAVASLEQKVGPLLISREQAKRFINIGVNVRERDVASLVADIEQVIEKELKLPPGYTVQYGGQFENLQKANQRLMVVVPIALGIIFLLLYLAFGTLTDALIIFMAVPLSAIGGVAALLVRDMPFSISSGIGFIALFGVSVLNGLVLLSAIKGQRKEDYSKFIPLIIDACKTRLRPVLMTALVAALGFLPMALSTGNGAEVQRPLATVVIGGLISSTFLTLFILPILYYVLKRAKWAVTSLVFLGFFTSNANAQQIGGFDELYSVAVKRNLEVLANTTASQITEIDKKVAGSLEPFQFDYNGGQINYRQFDHFFSVNQSLSGLIDAKTLKQLANEEKALLTKEKLLLLNELKYDLRYAYNNWQYTQAALLWYKDVLADYSLVLEKLRLQYKQGELDAVEWMLAQNEWSNVQNRYLALSAESLNFYRTISNMARLSTNENLKPDSFTLVSTLDASIPDTHSYFNFFNQKRAFIQRSAELEQKLLLKPEFAIGYFHQSIERQFNHQGVTATFSIPLDRRKAKATIDKAQLNAQLATEELKLKQNEFSLLLSQKKQQAVLLQNAREIYTESYVNNFNNNRIKVRLKLENGEIDVITYHQLMKSLIEARINHLEWMKNWNNNQIELAYLTQQL